MSEPAIRAEGLSKSYRVARPVGRNDTLRDALARGAGRAVRLAARSLRDPLGSLRSRRASGDETFWALREVSFAVAPGEVLGLVGSNGAGKSTLLKLLSRITEPTEGWAAIRGRVGSLLEVGTGFHSELTGRENIFLSGAILGMHRAEIRRNFDEIVAFAEVERFVDTPVKRYSSGMYLRLAFAVAAHLEPEVLLIDEVLAVGDAAFQRKCLGKMGDVARQGRTVLFVSHNLVAVESLCGRALWLSDGRIAAEGRPGAVIAEYVRSGAEAAPERAWEDREAAPGNDRVRLRRVRVLPEGGVPGDAIDVRTPFRLEIEYWNLRPGAFLSLAVHVYNDQGLVVWSAGPLEDPRPLPAGLYRDVCRVPGDLMNDGLHTVDLLVIEDLGIERLRASEVLRFDVRDHAASRGGWFGEWVGAVRPRLDWTTEAVELEAASENPIRSTPSMPPGSPPAGPAGAAGPGSQGEAQRQVGMREASG